MSEHHLEYSEALKYAKNLQQRLDSSRERRKVLRNVQSQTLIKAKHDDCLPREEARKLAIDVSALERNTARSSVLLDIYKYMQTS